MSPWLLNIFMDAVIEVKRGMGSRGETVGNGGTFCWCVGEMI